MTRRPIVDACLFSAEVDMLTLRLLTLADVVDQFVVVACSRTHQGQPVDRHKIEGAFYEAAMRAAQITARVTPATTTLRWIEPSNVVYRNGQFYERRPEERGPAGTRFFQHIERQHRDGMVGAVALPDVPPNAIVMMSDVDEIPSPDAVVRLQAAFARPAAWIVMAQRFHSGALDLLHPVQPWWGTCAALLGNLHPQEHRDARTTIGTANQTVTVMPQAGWHLSWFGSDAERQRKLDTFSHAELTGRYDPAEGRRALLHSNGEPLQQLTLGETYALDWPAPLLDGRFPLPDCWLTEDSWKL